MNKNRYLNISSDFIPHFQLTAKIVCLLIIATNNNTLLIYLPYGLTVDESGIGIYTVNNLSDDVCYCTLQVGFRNHSPWTIVGYTLKNMVNFQNCNNVNHIISPDNTMEHCLLFILIWHYVMCHQSTGWVKIMSPIERDPLWKYYSVITKMENIIDVLWLTCEIGGNTSKNNQFMCF